MKVLLSYSGELVQQYSIILFEAKFMDIVGDTMSTSSQIPDILLPISFISSWASHW